MILLTIETSTPRGSMALFQDDTLLAAREFDALRGHNAKLFAPLADLLHYLEPGMRLTDVLIGTGPGSYTGVRISIAVGNALALTYGATLHGYTSLAASDPPGRRYWVVGDARRGQFFRVPVREGLLEGAILTEPHDAWQAAVDEARCQEVPVVSFDAVPPCEGVALAKPCALRLATAWKKSGLTCPTGIVEPTYLAAPYITKARKIGKTSLPTS